MAPNWMPCWKSFTIDQGVELKDIVLIPKALGGIMPGVFGIFCSCAVIRKYVVRVLFRVVTFLFIFVNLRTRKRP